MTAVKRVAVASRSFSRHPTLRAELLGQYPGATFNETGRQLVGEELVAFLRGHDGAITALETLDDHLFSRVPELRVIAKFGVGLDMIDMSAMERHGVRLGWNGGVNRHAVAELVISFAISLLRFMPEVSLALRQGDWRPRVGRELRSQQVGIVGCGQIGKELVTLLRPFGCSIVAHDIRDYAEFYQANNVKPVTLEDLLQTSDVITLHVPLDDSTRNLMSAERLSRLKPDAILINAARGGLVDEDALFNMLRAGRLRGAACDVFVNEPAACQRLLSLPNFLGTPHIGGSTDEAVLAMGRAAIRGLATAGKPRVVAALE